MIVTKLRALATAVFIVGTVFSLPAYSLRLETTIWGNMHGILTDYIHNETTCECSAVYKVVTIADYTAYLLTCNKPNEDFHVYIKREEPTRWWGTHNYRPVFTGRGCNE